MTIEAGVILNLSSACDELLRYLYFRRPQDVDINSIELDYRSEIIEMAASELELDGYIEVIETRESCSYRITSKGQLKYRTSSFVKDEAEERKAKRYHKLKSTLELIFGAGALVLTFYTFNLDNKVDDQQLEIEALKQSLYEQKEIVFKLNEQIEIQRKGVENIDSRLQAIITKNEKELKKVVSSGKK